MAMAVPIPEGATFQDLRGRTFHMLHVAWYAGKDDRNHHLWLCVCMCGNTCVVGSWNLRHQKSCGCLNTPEAISARTRVHGSTRNPEYYSWSNMKSRCYCKTSQDYPLYGGRGIKVCEQWRKSFPQFLADMGRRPSPKHSLHRIDNDGDYCPENCKWALPDEQCLNRRSTHWITCFGVRRNLAQWQRETGIDQATIRRRLRLGWTPEAALSTPCRPTAKHRHVIYRGRRVQIKELAEANGLRAGTLQWRLSRGWSIEEAISTPAGEGYRTKAQRQTG